MQALRGWERIGFPRRRDYAAELLGISGRRLQELAHMDGFFTAPCDVARVFRGALATVQRRIERKHQRTASESEALDAILEHAFETWGLANAELQREHRVFERDGWRCTFPGCTSYGNLQDHHIEYRSHGGSDALSNRTSLCVWHHQRGEHAKILRCRGKAPGDLRFELGLRARRAPLARYRSGDVLVS